MAAAAPDPSAPPVFFVHLMKTAGTTLFRNLRLTYPLDQLYPFRDLDVKRDGKLGIGNHSVSYLLGLTPERHRSIRVYTGHFPFVTTELLGRPVTTVTILRDPVQRTLSLLRQFRRGTPWLAPEDRPTFPLPLEEIYEHPLVFETLVLNHQTKIFSMAAADAPESHMDIIDVDHARLAVAKENLTSVDVLGLTEQFDDLLDDVSTKLGWHVDRGARRNATPAAELDAVSPALLRRIASDNAIDLELYAYAKELHARRRAIGA